MKKMILAIATALTMTMSATAQRLTNVLDEARYLTDKMSIELNLTGVQSNTIYEINLAYLDGIKGRNDIKGHGWNSRNKQLKMALNASQWKKFKNAYYFYRPIDWRNDAYVHNIYAKYPKHVQTCNGVATKCHEHHCDKQHCGKKAHYCKKHCGKRCDHPCKPEVSKDKREFSNNSPAAIRMRQEMRRGTMNGAR